eukprot:g9625.t1
MENVINEVIIYLAFKKVCIFGVPQILVLGSVTFFCCIFALMFTKNARIAINASKKKAGVANLLPLVGEMQLFVKTPINDKTITLSVNLIDTVESVKQKIDHKLGVPVDEQWYLLFDGKILNNEDTLKHYNVQKESTLYLHSRLRGGMDNNSNEGNAMQEEVPKGLKPYFDDNLTFRVLILTRPEFHTYEAIVEEERMQKLVKELRPIKDCDCSGIATLRCSGTFPANAKNARSMNFVQLQLKKRGVHYFGIASCKREYPNEIEEIQLFIHPDKKKVFEQIDGSTRIRVQHLLCLSPFQRRYDACINLKNRCNIALNCIVEADDTKINIPLHPNVESYDIEEEKEDVGDDERKNDDVVVTDSLQTSIVPTTSDGSFFNRCQQMAIYLFLKAIVIILEGAPAIGKTTMIIGFLRKYLNVYGNGSSDMYALVSAPSNKAVQVPAIRFLNDVRNNNVPFIVVGVEDKLDPLLSEVFLDLWFPDLKKDLSLILEKLETISNERDDVEELIQGMRSSYQHVLRKINRFKYAIFPEHCQESTGKNFEILRESHIMNGEVQDIMNNMANVINDVPPLIEAVQKVLNILNKVSDKKMKARLLKQSDVIFATLCTSGRETMLNNLHERSLRVLIIDEAAQCIEPDLLIPFQLNPDQVVFVGDTKQLPAIVTSNVAKKKGYDRSIMSRLMKNGYSVFALNEQYRMHLDICRFSNNAYYDGRLKTHYTPRSFSVSKDDFLYKPCAFFNIESGVESKAGQSFKNEIEANYVLDIIKLIQSKPQHNFETIGIITFYNGQVDLIGRKLKACNIAFNTPGSRIRIHTVDGFQGDECDINIISCVRSNGTVGFLDDKRRLNVAMTRAKHNRIILGKEKTLCENKTTENIVDDAKNNHDFFEEQELSTMLRCTKKKKKKGHKKGGNTSEKDTVDAIIEFKKDDETRIATEDEEKLADSALRGYEDFYQLPHESATLGQVMNTSAGVDGFAKYGNRERNKPGNVSRK